MLNTAGRPATTSSDVATVPASATPPGKAAARVLIVDDEPQIVAILSDYVRGLDSGYEVATADNGPDAIAALDTYRPHVVLLDVMMPDMDGVSVLKHIKHKDERIRVIMVTGADHRIGAAALAGGALAYIPKPFDLRYIEQLIAVAVGG